MAAPASGDNGPCRAYAARMNSRLDSLLSTVLRHADNATTFPQRLAWTMLARSIAAQADAADARRAAMENFIAAFVAPTVVMVQAARDARTAAPSMVN